MSLVFKYFIILFENKLVFEYNFKLVYLILSVLFGLILYLLITIFIKAFNFKDLKLKY